MPSGVYLGNRVFNVVAVVFLLLALSAGAEADDVAGKFRIQPSFFIGGGASSVEVGRADQDLAVTISGGGGAGLGLTLGYGLASRFDLDFTIGSQTSSLSQPVLNATGTFSRTFYLASLMYRIPISDRHVVKVGGGGGLYKPGELDIDTSGVSNGFHDVVSYQAAFGTHMLAEFEIFMKGGWSASFGGKYYSVMYKESSGTRNGMLGFFNDADIANFDGSGFDLTASLAKYF